MRNYFMVMAAFTITITILIFAPWLLLILGAIWGIKIEIGGIGVSTPGLVKTIKEFRYMSKRIKEMDAELQREMQAHKAHAIPFTPTYEFECLRCKTVFEDPDGTGKTEILCPDCGSGCRCLGDRP